MMKLQGFEASPLEHATPVTFQPENVQLGSGTAVTFNDCPAGSEHPGEHEGCVVPPPTFAVVSVGQAPWGQLIVTVSVGACLVKPKEMPLTVIIY
jgi:hypothetical protein